MFFCIQGEQPQPQTSQAPPAGEVGQAAVPVLPAAKPGESPKRLHVSNIPFRFRDPDLRVLFGVRTNFVNLYLTVSNNDT